MNRYFTYILLILICISCKNRNGIVIPDTYTSKYLSLQLQERLDTYYSLNSRDSLLSFLSEWNQLIPSSSKEYIDQNDTLANIYQLFADMYNPFKFGNYKAINYFNDLQKYIVIQNDINYCVVSSGEYKRLVYKSSDVYPNDTAYEFYRNTKKLLNFRPPLHFTDVKFVYLTDEYKQALTDFLGLGSFKGDIIKNDSIYSKYNFLSPSLPIMYGHWGGYWHLETIPIIDRIMFDENFKHASVDFRYGLEETVLQYRLTKKSGHWEADNKWLKIRLE